MSAPNPQYDAILSVLSDQDVKSHLYRYHLGPETQYFVGDKEVVCLGVHRALEVAVFGQWHGPADEKPAVAPARIQACVASFLVRSATPEETAMYGGSKVVILLRVAEVEFSGPRSRTAKIIFRLPHSGFYNPVV